MLLRFRPELASDRNRAIIAEPQSTHSGSSPAMEQTRIIACCSPTYIALAATPAGRSARCGTAIVTFGVMRRFTGRFGVFWPRAQTVKLYQGSKAIITMENFRA